MMNMIPGITAGRPVDPVDASELPHRYWRISIFANSSNVSSISKITLRETAGGADTAAGKTALVTGLWDSPNNVFDGSDSSFAYTYGAAARNAPYTIGVDYGATAGDWKVIRQFTVRNRSDLAVQGPTAMLVQYSDDNVTWKNSWSEVDDDWIVTGQTRTYTKLGGTRTVIDIVAPPIDSGPNGIVFTPSGNAHVTGGRFVFDGTGDYYSNTTVAGRFTNMPWEYTVELGAVLSTGTSDGLLTIGSGSSRWIVYTQSGSIEVWEDGTQRMATAAGVLNGVTPKDVKIVGIGLNMYLYVNNVLLATGITYKVANATNIYLGTDPADISDRSMNGGFSRVTITHGLK